MTLRSIPTRTASRPAPARRQAHTLLWAGAALLLFVRLSAQSTPLNVEREGDRLRVSAPQLHVLSGRPMSRLHDGQSVTYVFSLSLQVGRGESTVARVTRRIIFSYDLWEERFSVVQQDDPKNAASHLSAAAAESWCVDVLSLPVRSAPADRTFVLKLECSLRDDGPRADAAPATTFTGLIDLFSRKTPPEPPRWEAISRPLRLSDLQNKAQR